MQRSHSVEPRSITSAMELNCGITTAFIAVLVLLLYRFLTANYGHWKKRGIPVPAAVVPGFGHMLPLLTLRNGISTMMEEIHKAHAKSSMVGMYLLRKPVLLVRDADLIKTVLQTEFNSFRHHPTMEGSDPLLDQNAFFLNDEKWKSSRSVFLSAMTSKKLKAITLVLRDGCLKFVNYLNKQLEGQQTVDIEGKALFKRVTVEVSANAVLSVEEGIFDEGSPKIFQTMLETIFAPSTLQAIAGTVMFFLPSLGFIFGNSFVPSWVSKRFTKIVDNLMDERESGKTKREDILQHMAAYRAEKNLSRSSIISTIFAFFTESYETTSLTTSFLACDLAQYQEVQDKLRREINSVADKFGGDIPYEAISTSNVMCTSVPPTSQ